MAKANDFACLLGDSTFKANNGQIERFKLRHDLTFIKMNGKSASVDQNILNNWRKKITSFINANDPKNIFNADETGLFFNMNIKY